MKHKNAEMIKAVVDNVELVVMAEVIEPEDDSRNYWAVSNLGVLAVASNSFFLCLPQHKEACLHWLNGGESQLEYTHQSYPTWNSIDSDAKGWSIGNVFMDSSLKIRIKPKKEKRWIRYSSKGVLKDEYINKPECINRGDQLIEIEVEV